MTEQDLLKYNKIYIVEPATPMLISNEKVEDEDYKMTFNATFSAIHDRRKAMTADLVLYREKHGENIYNIAKDRYGNSVYTSNPQVTISNNMLAKLLLLGKIDV